MSNELELKEVIVQKIQLEPGEVLVVTIKQKLDNEALKRMANVFTNAFPNNQVVLSGGIEIGLTKVLAVVTPKANG